MSCKNCRHYSFYQMITQGSYGYSGTIPCLTCARFSIQRDNFEPIFPVTIITCEPTKKEGDQHEKDKAPTQPDREARTTKVKLHEELNQAYSKLLRICLLLDLNAYYKDLEQGRTFLSNMVDHSTLPGV